MLIRAARYGQKRLAKVHGNLRRSVEDRLGFVFTYVRTHACAHVCSRGLSTLSMHVETSSLEVERSRYSSHAPSLIIIVMNNSYSSHAPSLIIIVINASYSCHAPSLRIIVINASYLCQAPSASSRRDTSLTYQSSIFVTMSCYDVIS